jgi:hypothetical protein
MDYSILRSLDYVLFEAFHTTNSFQFARTIRLGLAHRKNTEGQINIQTSTSLPFPFVLAGISRLKINTAAQSEGAL